MDKKNKVLNLLGILLFAAFFVVFLVFLSQDFRLWVGYDGFSGALGRIFALGVFGAPDLMMFLAYNIGYAMNLILMISTLFMVAGILFRRALKVVFVLLAVLFPIAGQLLLVIMGQQVIFNPVILAAIFAAGYQLLLGLFQIISHKKARRDALKNKPTPKQEEKPEKQES